MNSYKPPAAFTLERWHINYWFKKITYIYITKGYDEKLPVHLVIDNCIIIKPKKSYKKYIFMDFNTICLYIVYFCIIYLYNVYSSIRELIIFHQSIF